jgi:hypothetical protein
LPQKQLYSKLGLKALDALGNIRRGYAEALGGAGEVLALGSVAKIGKL